MPTMRFVRTCVDIVLLLFVVVAPVHAGLTGSIVKIAADVTNSFGQTAYYPSAPDQAPGQVDQRGQIAFLAPTLEINTIRQYLDRWRMTERAGNRSPKVGFDGQALQVSFGGALPTGGGASADKGDPFERWGVFLNADVDVAHQDTVGTQLGFKTRTNNYTIGADYRLPGNHVLGASVNFLRSDADLKQGTASQDAKGYGFTLFGSFVPAPNGYIDAIVNFGHNRYDGDRLDDNATFSSKTSGNQWGFALSAGYGLTSGALTVTPYGRVEYVHAKVGGFTETGNSAGVATISDQRIKVTTLAAGALASYAISTSWGVLIPNGRIEYQHLAHASRGDTTLQFGTAAPIPLASLGQDKNYGTFAVGATGVFGSGVSGFFNYQQLFGNSAVRDRIYTLGLRIDF